MNAPQWKIKADGKHYGPYSDLDMAQFITDRRVTGSTLVSHTTITKGLWQCASDTSELRRYFDLAHIPVPPPLPSDQASRHEKKRRSRNLLAAAFPICLIFIWGGWFASLVLIMILYLVSGERSPTGYITSGSVVSGFNTYTEAEWFASAATFTVICAFILALPATVLTGMAYAFCKLARAFTRVTT